MKLQMCAASYVGLVRENNEDMILMNHRFIRNGSCSETVKLSPEDRCIVALADGMGGHNKGEVASSEVLRNLDFFYGDMPNGLDLPNFTEGIYEWLASVNTIIDSKGYADPCFVGMGTTLVGLAYYLGDFFWMNCGDSRLYHLRNGHLRQVSTDHSLNNLMGYGGHSNVVTNCIGGGCKNSYIDLVCYTANIMPGDTLLLCSDGLNDMIEDALIEQTLNEGADADALCEAAVKAGGYDNVSVCIIKIED